MKLKVFFGLLVCVCLSACSSADHDRSRLCGYAKMCCMSLGAEETEISDCSVFDDYSYDECKAYLDERGEEFRADDESKGLPPRTTSHPAHCYTSLDPLPDAAPQ